ncbi:MAG: histidinol-phosphatase [Alphaproteobacteria bacterium]
MPETQRLVAFLHRLADAAAPITLADFRRHPEVTNKAVGTKVDPVTRADRQAETIIRSLIEAEFPDHGIVGEELAPKPGNAYNWFIDPIDGTRAYICGVPVWGTLIGLEHEQTAFLGLLDQPFLGERYVGQPGATLLSDANGTRQISTSGCTTLATAKLGCTTPELFAPGIEQENFNAVAQRCAVVRYGGDCYFYGLVACGHMDLIVEASLNPFDILALIPIIEGAGGVVTTWGGGPANAGGRVVAAATPELHAQALALLGVGL